MPNTKKSRECKTWPVFTPLGSPSRDGTSFVSLLRIYRLVAVAGGGRDIVLGAIGTHISHALLAALINSLGHRDHTETGSRWETEMGKG